MTNLKGFIETDPRRGETHSLLAVVVSSISIRISVAVGMAVVSTVQQVGISISLGLGISGPLAVVAVVAVSVGVAVAVSVAVVSTVQEVGVSLGLSISGPLAVVARVGTTAVCSLTMGSPRVWVTTALVPTVREPWLASLTWVLRAGAPKTAGTSWTAPFRSPLSPATAL